VLSSRFFPRVMTNLRHCLNFYFVVKMGSKEGSSGVDEEDPTLSPPYTCLSFFVARFSKKRSFLCL